MTFNKFDSFTKVAEKFLEIISQENELLEINQLDEVSELLLQKRALAAEYETQLNKAMQAFQSGEVSHEEKTNLITLMSEVREMLQINEHNLLVNLKANEKFLEIIVRSAKKRSTPNCYYTKTGFFRKSPNNISMMSVDTKF